MKTHRIFRVNVFSLLLCVLFISGCESAPLLDKDKPLVQAGHGLAFCTFFYGEPEKKADKNISAQTSITLVIHQLGAESNFYYLSTQDKNAINGGWKATEITKVADGKVSLISAVSLPVGEYEVTSTAVHVPVINGQYSATFPLAQPFQFSVKENEAVYLGAHGFNQITSQNVSGKTVPYKVAVATFDHFDEDKNSLLKVRPETEKLMLEDALRVQSTNKDPGQ